MKKQHTDPFEIAQLYREAKRLGLKDDELTERLRECEKTWPQEGAKLSPKEVANWFESFMAIWTTPPISEVESSLEKLIKWDVVKEVRKGVFTFDRKKWYKLNQEEIILSGAMPIKKFDKDFLPKEEATKLLNILLRYPNSTMRKWFDIANEENVTHSRKMFWKIIDYLRKNHLIFSQDKKMGRKGIKYKISAETTFLKSFYSEADKIEQNASLLFKDTSEDIRDKKISNKTAQKKISNYIFEIYRCMIEHMEFIKRVRMDDSIKNQVLNYCSFKLISINSMFTKFMIRHNFIISQFTQFTDNWFEDYLREYSSQKIKQETLRK